MIKLIFLAAMTLTTLSYGSGNGGNGGGVTAKATGTSANIITTVDSSGDTGYFTSITIGTDGLPVISYA